MPSVPLSKVLKNSSGFTFIEAGVALGISVFIALVAFSLVFHMGGLQINAAAQVNKRNLAVVWWDRVKTETQCRPSITKGAVLQSPSLSAPGITDLEFDLLDGTGVLKQNEVLAAYQLRVKPNGVRFIIPAGTTPVPDGASLLWSGMVELGLEKLQDAPGGKSISPNIIGPLIVRVNATGAIVSCGVEIDPDPAALCVALGGTWSGTTCAANSGYMCASGEISVGPNPLTDCISCAPNHMLVSNGATFACQPYIVCPAGTSKTGAGAAASPVGCFCNNAGETWSGVSCAPAPSPTPTATIAATPTPTATLALTPTPTATAGASPTPTATVGISPTPTATAGCAADGTVVYISYTMCPGGVINPTASAPFGTDALCCSGTTYPVCDSNIDIFWTCGTSTVTPTPTATIGVSPTPTATVSVSGCPSGSSQYGITFIDDSSCTAGGAGVCSSLSLPWAGSCGGAFFACCVDPTPTPSPAPTAAASPVPSGCEVAGTYCAPPGTVSPCCPGGFPMESVCTGYSWDWPVPAAPYAGCGLVTPSPTPSPAPSVSPSPAPCYTYNNPSSWDEPSSSVICYGTGPDVVINRGESHTENVFYCVDKMTGLTYMAGPGGSGGCSGTETVSCDADGNVTSVKVCSGGGP